MRIRKHVRAYSTADTARGYRRRTRATAALSLLAALAGVAWTPPAANAQARAGGASTSRIGGAYSRYARAILRTADSAALTLRDMNAELAGTSGVGADEATLLGALRPALAKGRVRASRLAGDFDAVVPPADFERLHAQLVAPLQDLAARIDRIARLFDIDCASERAAGLGCDEARLKAEASQRALGEFYGLGLPMRSYLEARDRAMRMLAEHGVTLPPLTVQ